MENKICIYAICKNEINFVHQWIDNMSEADYIVVLDTGSTDGTYEVLKNDPRITKVKQKKYKNFRFDVARNESLKLVPEDANILFCTDFDELLEPGWGNILRNSWTEQCWRGKYTYVWSHTDAGNPGVTFTYDKIHRPGYYWRFAVHEVLALTNDMEETIDLEEHGPEGTHVADYGNSIVLHHYPIDIEHRNYLPLLLTRFEENPEEAYSSYLLGREYMMLGPDYFDEALKYFNICLQVPTIDVYSAVKYTVLGYIGAIHVDRQIYPEAIMYYHKQLQIDNTHREPYTWLAEVYSRLGHHQIAIYYIEECVFKRCYRHMDWSEQAPVWNEKPYDILANSYYQLGDSKTALRYTLEALKLAPNDTRLQGNYLAILKEIEQ